MGKSRIVCNDCQFLKLMVQGEELAYRCTKVSGNPTVKDIMKPCQYPMKPRGCTYCNGEAPVFDNGEFRIVLESNTNHPKGESDILMMAFQLNGHEYKKRLSYCPYCNRKFN